MPQSNAVVSRWRATSVELSYKSGRTKYLYLSFGSFNSNRSWRILFQISSRNVIRQGWALFRGPFLAGSLQLAAPLGSTSCNYGRVPPKTALAYSPSRAIHSAKDSLLCVGLDPHKSELQEDSAEGAFRFCQRLIEDGWRWSWGWFLRG